MISSIIEGETGPLTAKESADAAYFGPLDGGIVQRIHRLAKGATAK